MLLNCHVHFNAMLLNICKVSFACTISLPKKKKPKSRDPKCKIHNQTGLHIINNAQHSTQAIPDKQLCVWHIWHTTWHVTHLTQKTACGTLDTQHSVTHQTDNMACYTPATQDSIGHVRHTTTACVMSDTTWHQMCLLHNTTCDILVTY